MTDIEFIEKIRLSMIYAQKHASLISEIDREYFRRYGAYPSDVDDDFWIDTVHLGHGSIPTIEQIRENAELRDKTR